MLDDYVGRGTWNLKLAGLLFRAADEQYLGPIARPLESERTVLKHHLHDVKVLIDTLRDVHHTTPANTRQPELPYSDIAVHLCIGICSSLQYNGDSTCCWGGNDVRPSPKYPG